MVDLSEITPFPGEEFDQDEIQHSTPPIVNPHVYTSTRHRERPPPTMFEMLQKMPTGYRYPERPPPSLEDLIWEMSANMDTSLDQDCDGKASVGLLLADWNKRFNEE